MEVSSAKPAQNKTDCFNKTLYGIFISPILKMTFSVIVSFNKNLRLNIHTFRLLYLCIEF